MSVCLSVRLSVCLAVSPPIRQSFCLSILIFYTYTGLFTLEDWNFPNPCSRDNLLSHNLRHPYPNNNQKFLMCDLSGNMYAVNCPENMIYVQVCAQTNTISR
jgi:hypothetical protein